MEIAAAIIGGIFVLIAALIPVIISNRRQKVILTDTSSEVDKVSKYAVCRIPDIIKNELRNAQLNVDGLFFKPSFTISDLKVFTKKIYYPRVAEAQIDTVIDNAREKAFTLKYAEPKEDEKITALNKIKISGLKHWETYFYDLLQKLKLDNFNSYEILDIGIGNGSTVKNLYKNTQNVIGVDISKKALDNAKRILPNVKLIQNEAENLRDIPNSSIDLVLGFRTFQSTLLDKRSALYETYRVLNSGGYLITSIPIMFLKEDGTVLKGLIPPGQKTPTIDYAEIVLGKLIDLLDTLNFIKIEVYKDSPFEYYVSAQRP
ncbi:class I SAM-dependent methyltransferase [Marinifilum fragile]|uniref:class I SAM-dependent methyltransferase n=1 Tax=Marinifilum fragile TaxID=570161 RepID=UPI002AA672D7|nr:class I SAM-dependent methyltransferase [Marinifilum fragile]